MEDPNGSTMTSFMTWTQATTNSTLSLVLAAIFLLFISQLKNKKGEKKNYEDDLNLPPGPYAWPVIGNLLQLGKKPHETLTSLRNTYGDIYKIQLGSRTTVVLNGLTVIKQALIKQAEDFAGRPDFYTFNFIANGKSMGFGDYGPRWKMHRRIAQNAMSIFINNRVNPIEIAIQDEANLLVSNLCEKFRTDPHNEVYLSVGNIICAMCFGKRYQREDPEYVQLVKMNEEFMSYAGAGNPVDIMPWMRHFTQRSFKNFLKILKTMDTFCLKKRNEHLQTYDPDNLRDVTDALIKAVRDIPQGDKDNVGLTDEHILTTVQEMIGAGFDTIATTLQWAILFFATHPHVQERAQKEIDDVIGKDHTPSHKDVASLPFVEACIWEIMRHSCIFPFALPHATTKDTYLDNYFIPDKTLIFVNLWSVSRDENKFPEPEKFDPLRFLHEDKNEINKDMLDNFVPFGAGRRRCPGEPLGKMEIFIFIVTLLQKCKISTISGKKYSLESKYGLTLKPRDFEAVFVLRK